jgi:hypothetical protein
MKFYWFGDSWVRGAELEKIAQTIIELIERKYTQ